MPEEGEVDGGIPGHTELSRALRFHPETCFFEATLWSARAARRTLSSIGLAPALLEKSEYIVSELGTNSLVHAKGPFLLRIWWDTSWARVEIQDSSPRLPVVRPLSAGTSGRGLRIVDGLARRWGSYLTERGKVVWAEVD